jgi:hypothetical protein
MTRILGGLRSTWTHWVELHGIACVHFMLGVREGDELVTAAHLEVQNSFLLTVHHHKSGSTRQTVLFLATFLPTLKLNPHRVLKKRKNAFSK